MYVSGKTQAELRYDTLNTSFREGLSEESGTVGGKGSAGLDARRKSDDLLSERRTDTVTISTRAMAAYKEAQEIKRDLLGTAPEAEPADSEGRVTATAENGSDVKLKEPEAAGAGAGVPSTDTTDQLKQQLKEAKERLEEAKRKLEEAQQEAKGAENEGELAAANAKLQAAQQEVSSAQASVTEISSQIQVLSSSG